MKRWLPLLGAVIGGVVAAAIAWALAGADVNKLGDWRNGAGRFLGMVTAIGLLAGYVVTTRVGSGRAGHGRARRATRSPALNGARRVPGSRLPRMSGRIGTIQSIDLFLYAMLRHTGWYLRRRFQVKATFVRTVSRAVFARLAFDATRR